MPDSSQESVVLPRSTASLPATPQANPAAEQADDSVSLASCARCGHPADWHRLDDSLNVGPTDPAAEFRCIGYDCSVAGPIGSCDLSCPDYREDGVLAESGTAAAFARARESIRSMHRERVLCAHADRSGEGAHWRYADEPCQEAR